MSLRPTLVALGAFLTLTLALAACDAAQEKLEELQEQLEFAGFSLTADDEDDGGFSLDLESIDAFVEEMADEFAADVEQDPPAEEVESAPPSIDPGGPDVAQRMILIQWGQPVPNPDAEATTWEGSISTSAGALIPIKKVKMEEGDKLVPSGEAAVGFQTTTKPHHDGVLLRLIVPKAEVQGATLSFDAGFFQQTVELKDVLGGLHGVSLADDQGDVVKLDAIKPHRCAFGPTTAQWKRLDEVGGVFGGTWKNAGPEGAKGGKWAGLWGTVEGKRRLKGVFMDETDKPMGIIKGSWSPFPETLGVDGGVYSGIFKGKEGEVKGILKGTFLVTPEPGAGVASGHWLSACGDEAGGPGLCGADANPIPLDVPEPDCDCAGDDSCTCNVKPPKSCIEKAAPEGSEEPL